MDQIARENLLRVRKLEANLPLNLWLTMVTEALSTVVPPNSALVRELGALRNDTGAARMGVAGSAEDGNASENGGGDTKARQYVHSILDTIDSVADLYKPPPTHQDLLDESKRELNRELDNAKQNLRKEVDFAISEQIFKHLGFKILFGLLIALVGAFLGIDIMLSQKVIAAQRKVAEMQEQVNGAKLTIYEKASELNKALDSARQDLQQRRDGATDVLNNDRDSARKEIDGVRGAVTSQIKNQGALGTDHIMKEEHFQIDRLGKEAAEKIAHIREPWAMWLLVRTWALPGLALLFSIAALLVSVIRRKAAKG